ncbi:hypothetical protein AB0K48_59765, partial [Nonomuraea sp. NPDC055795]
RERHPHRGRGQPARRGELHLVPVLLGDGRRLFEATGLDPIELEPVRRLEGSDATHLRYRVTRPLS